MTAAEPVDENKGTTRSGDRGEMIDKRKKNRGVIYHSRPCPFRSVGDGISGDPKAVTKDGKGFHQDYPGDAQDKIPIAEPDGPQLPNDPLDLPVYHRERENEILVHSKLISELCIKNHYNNNQRQENKIKLKIKTNYGRAGEIAKV